VAWTNNLKKSNILKIQMTKDRPATACDSDCTSRKVAVPAAKAPVASHKTHRKLKMASSNHTVEVKAPARKKSIASLQA
jgi:hypothetical protein